MQQANLAALDLNLLRVLDTLLRERHLTRAAKQLGLSQPAASHALARLRAHFGDPLFLRSPRGLLPTPRAAALEGKLRAAMVALSSCASFAPSFDPRAATTAFTLATADYGAFVLAPPILRRFAERAPGASLWVRSLGDDVYGGLAHGNADVDVGPVHFGAIPAGVQLVPLFEEQFVCVVREAHPRVKKKLDLATYAALPHAFVAPYGTAGGIVDEVLAKHGLKRRLAMIMPHFLLAPHLIAESDMVLTTGRRVAEAFAKILPLRILEPPVAIPSYTMQLAWHERNSRDPAQVWFRELIVETAGGGAMPRGRRTKR